MGSLRFRRQIRLAPGLKLDINKQSLGLTAGVRGAHVTVNTKGQRTLSAGLPGTGLSYRDTRRVRTPGQVAANVAVWAVCGYVVGALIGIAILIALCW